MNPAVESMFHTMHWGMSLATGSCVVIGLAVAVWWALGRVFGGVFLPRAASPSPPPFPPPFPPPTPPVEAGPYREPAMLGVDPERIFASATRVPRTCPTCGAEMCALEFKKQLHTLPKEQGGDERFHRTWHEEARYECGRCIWWTARHGDAQDRCPTTSPLCKRLGCDRRTERGAFCGSNCAVEWAEANVGTA